MKNYCRTLLTKFFLCFTCVCLCSCAGKVPDVEMQQTECLELEDENVIMPIIEQDDAYESQKNIAADLNKYYQEHWGIDISTYLDADNKMLDRLYEYLSEKLLLRQNMAELYAKSMNNNTYYSIVWIAGYDTEFMGICLVQYRIQNNEVEILSVDRAQQDLTAYGVHFGITQDNEPICYGIAKATQMLSDASGRKPSAIVKMQLINEDGSQEIIDLPDKPFFFIEKLPSNHTVVKVDFLNENGGSEEQISQDELVYFICESFEQQ